ncbi:hypothetical protein [Streptosporangium sp. OZ121]|uniref:hypothetical protein n=1 Tax=Streptosporangium sp. OZ121 TaxID=3444183 RepID=UPI003F79E038
MYELKALNGWNVTVVLPGMVVEPYDVIRGASRRSVVGRADGGEILAAVDDSFSTGSASLQSPRTGKATTATTATATPTMPATPATTLRRLMRRPRRTISRTSGSPSETSSASAARNSSSV